MESSEIDKNLDIILAILKLSNKNAGGIRMYLADNYNLFLSDNDVKMLIKKLEDDGYITIDNDGVGRCKLTLSSKSFIGYEKTMDDNTFQKIRLDTAITYQREQADTLNRLTGYIAVATIAASVIALAIFFLQWYFYLHPVAPK